MALTEFVERVVARLAQMPVDFAPLAPQAVPGSIFTGGAGIALFFHEAARLCGDGALLAHADRWCAGAKAWASQTTPAHWHERPQGFVLGEGGLSYVEAVLGARRGDRERVVAAVESIDRACMRLLNDRRPRTEYLGGAAGIVCAAIDLAARLPSEAAYDGPRALLGRVRARGVELLLGRYGGPLAPRADDCLGFAHGFAGELWALVLALGADHAIVRARLEELAALRELDEEGLVYFSRTLGDADPELLPTWCNGMAGHTLLWCEVARQTRSPRWIELARLCAESTAVLGNGNPSLCCGLAGASLALQRYADLAGDARAARRAYRRLVSAVRVADGNQEGVFLGLWQGTLGIALVAMTRLYGEKAIAVLEPLGGNRTGGARDEALASRPGALYA